MGVNADSQFDLGDTHEAMAPDSQFDPGDTHEAMARENRPFRWRLWVVWCGGDFCLS